MNCPFALSEWHPHGWVNAGYSPGATRTGAWDVVVASLGAGLACCCTGCSQTKTGLDSGRGDAEPGGPCRVPRKTGKKKGGGGGGGIVRPACIRTIG